MGKHDLLIMRTPMAGIRIMDARRVALHSLVELKIEVFSQGCAAHCCQHIVDNIQTDFGVKSRPLFWRCAWAKDKESFKVYLKYNYKL